MSEKKSTKQPSSSQQTGNQQQVVKMELSPKGKVIIISMIALFCIVIGLLLFFLLRDQPEEIQEIQTPTGNIIINPNNLDDIVGSLTEQIERGMFNTYMNTTWVFPDSNSPSSNAVMGNSPSNNYPFWFDLVIGNEEVFKSSLLPVGSQLKEIILNADLPPGEYNAIMDINMIDENNQPVQSDMKFGITIIIQN